MVTIRPKVLAKKLQFNNAPLGAQIQILKRYEFQAGPFLHEADQVWLSVTIANLEKEERRRRKVKAPAK